MKIIRQLIRAKLLEKIPTLARVDRFNHQYDNTDEEVAVDYGCGAVYVEVLPVAFRKVTTIFRKQTQ